MTAWTSRRDIEHRACRGANRAWWLPNVGQHHGKHEPLVPTWQDPLQAGPGRQAAADTAPWLQPDLHVGLPLQTVDPVSPRLAHFFHVDALAQLVPRLLENGQLRFVAGDELENDEVVAASHRLGDVSRAEREGDGIQGLGEPSGLEGAEEPALAPGGCILRVLAGEQREVFASAGGGHDAVRLLAPRLQLALRKRVRS